MGLAVITQMYADYVMTICSTWNILPSPHQYNLRRQLRRTPATPPLLTQQLLHIDNLFSQQMEFAGQALDIGGGAAVDVEVEFAAQAVFGVLPVLAHHDDGRLDGGQHGKKQIEQDEGIGVP